MPRLPKVLQSLVLPCLLLTAIQAQAIQGTWTLLPNSPPAGPYADRHDDLTFINEMKGWVVNGDGKIYRTTNGGDSWTELPYSSGYNRCVAFTDSLHGYIGYLNRKDEVALIRTVNSGSTWTPVSLPQPVPEGLCGLFAAGGQVVYGVGAFYGYPTLIKTDDNGASWTSLDMSPWCGALVDCYFWHPDSGIAVGSTNPGLARQPVVLRTVDGGASWTVRWTGSRTRELCWKISFPSRRIGFVSIENLSGTGPAYYLKTSNRGITWQEHLFSNDYRDCQGIGFADEETGWIGGWEFGTEATSDGGVTWQPAGFGWNMNRFRFLSPAIGYACGDRVYKWTATTAGVPTGNPVEPPPPRLLGQNSPNPFDQRTRIRYRVTEAGPVTLALYDMQGRQVKSLFRGERSPGDYEVVLEADDLSGGAYAYRLTTASGTESRKLWVVR